MKHQGYLNRALKSHDRRYTRIFGKLGYDVAAMATEAGVDLTPVPDNWQSLPWVQLRALAADLSDTKIRSKADAIAAVGAEVERRKNKGDS